MNFTVCTINRKFFTMKKITNFSWLCLLLIISNVSCVKEHLIEKELATSISVEDRSNCDRVLIELEELPNQIISFLEENYPNVIIKSIVMKTCMDESIIYEVKFKRGPKLRFDAEGNLLGHGNEDENNCATIIIDANQLPEAILAYIADNHPEGTIRNVKMEVCPDSTTTFIVKVSPGPRLYFDEEGNLLEEATDDDDDDENEEEEEEDCEKVVIDVDELPAAALQYLEENYPNSHIANVKKETCPNDSITFIVKVSPGPRLYFDEEGNLLEEAADDDDDDENEEEEEEDCEKVVIDVDELPEAALQYLEENYPNSHIANVKKETCADGTITYEVKVSPGPRLYFDEEGNLIP